MRQVAGLVVYGLLPLAALGAIIAQVAGDRSRLVVLDFRAFYTGGLMVAGGVRGDLYDVATQLAWQRSWVPEAMVLADLAPFRSPPFAALPFALVAGMVPPAAYAVWGVANLAAAAYLAWLVQDLLRTAPVPVRLRSAALVLTFLPLMVSVAHGQLSIFLALSLLQAYRALRAERDLTAGLWLSLLCLKPQLLVLPLLLLVWKRRWKGLRGFAIGASALAAISLAVVGVDGLRGFIQMSLGTVGWQEQLALSPRSMHTWRGFWHLLLQTDEAGLTALPWIAGLGAAALALWWFWRGPWRPREGRFDLQFAALVLLGLLASPYANFHDLSVLVVAGALAARQGFGTDRENAARRLLVGVSSVGYLTMWPALLLAPALHLQISVLFMVGALLALAMIHAVRCAESPATGPLIAATRPG